MSNLVIVESPTKAKTISKFLGKDYMVHSSYGHVRDLPKKKMGIDIEHDFKPEYIPIDKAKDTISSLKKLAKKAEIVYFAPDEDREGEAIAWHLKEILDVPDKKSKRITFHEITKSAIENALKNPREINFNLVDAQQARRILDRLVGYELSPFLWKKVAKGLSAGRVQSVAVRFIVERERERQAFKQEEYWTVETEFAKSQIDTNKNTNDIFKGKLHKIDEKILDKLAIGNEKEAQKILKDLEKANYAVAEIKKRQTNRKVPAPYITSSLQQDAYHKLGLSAKQTMFIAQGLYEGVDMKKGGSRGLITYMRTDSTNLAKEFIVSVREYIEKEFSKKYLPEKEVKHKTKSKLEEEEHEAIRPTDITHTPESIKNFLNDKQFKLYDLIWKRAIACQMKEAIIDNTTIDICNVSKNCKKYTFRSAGSVVKFDGFLKVYTNLKEDNILPELKEKDSVDLKKIEPLQHFTEPPARYSEATLVKKLEEEGIGRPSTYAPIISTIQDRNYVHKEEGRLVPQDIAYVVNDLLVKHFKTIVDYKFTAKMEDDFDEIASGKTEWEPVIKDFYEPFKENLDQKYEEVKKSDLVNQETDEKCEKCGKPMIIKTARFGKFLACTGFPECKNTISIKSNNGNAKDENGDVIIEKEKKREPEKTDEKCEKCGAPMVIREGRFGRFIACSSFPKCRNTKALDQDTGVECPQCKKGKIVAKRARSKKTFYACDQYPDCKFALWSKPTGEKCPDCGSLLVGDKNDKVKCSNKECDFKK